VVVNSLGGWSVEGDKNLSHIGRFAGLRCLQWLIVGGESGPGARPMEADWVRTLRDQANAVGCYFFFKQWGGERKHLHGRLLDDRTWDHLPEWVQDAVHP
jgi:protein gp37